VLITTYNYGQFVEQAIESVLAQDFPRGKLQVLVVDDGSTDDTAERVRKYGSRVEYFYQPNGGQASALNIGFAKARGEIIALLDADDFFLPGKLARTVEAFEQNPAAGLVYHRLREWDMNSDENREAFDFVPVSGDARTAPEIFRTYTPQPTSCICFRRSALDKLLPIPEHVLMMADCFVVTLLPLVAPIIAIPETLAVYRFHGANCFHADVEQMPIEIRRRRQETWGMVIDAMRAWLGDNGYTRKQRAVRILLDRWEVMFEGEQFRLEPPGRVRFFLFLVKRNFFYRPLQTWRFTVWNFLSAPLGLFLGYKGAQVIENLRVKSERGFRRYLRGDEGTAAGGVR
ncbi:MAG: glycosyltransferase, partial [Candidatus Acidiferrum sp.]